MKTDEIYRDVTERIVSALRNGVVPWKKPWVARPPTNLSSWRVYRGVNLLLLGLTAAERGYSSPYWLTYKQAQGLGGQVRRGERGTRVIFWKVRKLLEKDRATGEEVEKKVPLLRFYTVFNTDQCDGLDVPVPRSGGDVVPLDRAVDTAQLYLEREGIPLLHGGDQAFYVPGLDRITLPPQRSFVSTSGYYATLFHEIGHSTGHPSRLNRPGIAERSHFGSERYSKEELVAEMTSAMLVAHSGLEWDDDNSASYIGSWLKALENDHRLVVYAAAQAHRALDFVLTGARPKSVSELESEAEGAVITT